MFATEKPEHFTKRTHPHSEAGKHQALGLLFFSLKQEFNLSEGNEQFQIPVNFGEKNFRLKLKYLMKWNFIFQHDNMHVVQRESAVGLWWNGQLAWHTCCLFLLAYINKLFSLRMQQREISMFVREHLNHRQTRSLQENTYSLNTQIFKDHVIKKHTKKKKWISINKYKLPQLVKGSDRFKQINQQIVNKSKQIQ